MFGLGFSFKALLLALCVGLAAPQGASATSNHGSGADAYISALRAAPELHVHDMSSSKAGEHEAVMDLVPRSEATHIAIKSGSWFDPSTWYKGAIPGDDARVLIPEGAHVTYDGVSNARLFTVRVDGHLHFATDVSSQMILDTMVVSPSGMLMIGTEADPVQAGVNVDIIIANNGPIDTDWDPMLLSRGIISHGDVSIHGAIKDSHEKVIEDPQAGDTWVQFGTPLEGWQVGDTIVIAGTSYDGYKWDGFKTSHFPSEDEVRIISHIEGGTVFFDEPLTYHHDAPREDLKTSVANYTRNVSISTENPETAEIYERGHVMFMHSDDVDVRYAEFFELGRTDKSETSMNVGKFDTISYDSNVQGRYSFHLHRTGVSDVDNPAIVVGNAVYGSPGWGFVHHDSNAILDNNATYDTFGAGYVAETGNEIGAWTDNIAIYAQGINWNNPKLATDLQHFDIAKGGDGFWFQGRMVDSIDNIAASVNTGFVYFHRDGDGGMIQFDSSLFDHPGALNYVDMVGADRVPVLSFSGNEVFAAREGLSVMKANPNQGHDIHSVFEDFTAWSVMSGASFEYTSHYLIKDFDLIGKDPTLFSDPATGISFGTNTFDMTIVSPTISGFKTGINLAKGTTGFTAENHNYIIVDPQITDVGQDYANRDPALDRILSSSNLPKTDFDLILDEPLTYKEGWPDPDARVVRISGTKIDSLGESDFPGGVDSVNVGFRDVITLLEKNGYYTTEQGQNYFLLDLYSSDRLTGDIYVETHPVFIDPNVPLGSPWHAYANAKSNGILNLDDPNAPTLDEATLWAHRFACETLPHPVIDKGAWRPQVSPHCS
jgi:hypothetical protein